ncbi:MAG: hypothetical protein Ct9H300mP31_13660 [Acidimicrobiaceae bacterium]|nr:MAG: hypothetical protein Ct9H300mP31_13660 [Acidimicrobiaceae bacterium]
MGYALAWPDRFEVAYGAIDWAELGRLDFEKTRKGTVSRAWTGPIAPGRLGERAPGPLVERRQRGSCGPLSP